MMSVGPTIWYEKRRRRKLVPDSMVHSRERLKERARTNPLEQGTVVEWARRGLGKTILEVATQVQEEAV
jgi:hypothetical protein